MTRTAAATAVSPTTPDLRRELGTRAIVFMVLAGAAPLTAVTAVIPYVLLLSGNIAGAVYFLASAVVLALFSVGYTLMARHIDQPGAMYSYISVGLGRVAGAGAAMLAVAAYFANLLAVYVLGGVFASQTIASLAGWSSPWWLWAFIMFAAVAVLGYLNIDVSAKVLGSSSSSRR